MLYVTDALTCTYTLCIIFALHYLGGRPQLKDLKYIMKYEGVTTKWYDIGLQLLCSDDVVVLDEIRTNHPIDVNKCCTEMFSEWLRRVPDASWNQLAEALKKAGLNTAAKNVIRGQYHGCNSYILHFVRLWDCDL